MSLQIHHAGELIFEQDQSDCVLLPLSDTERALAFDALVGALGLLVGANGLSVAHKNHDL